MKVTCLKEKYTQPVWIVLLCGVTLKEIHVMLRSEAHNSRLAYLKLASIDFPAIIRIKELKGFPIFLLLSIGQFSHYWSTCVLKQTLSEGPQNVS